ncbi:unnamed protein product [Nezara viridula]|uniref:polynucleotide adenylyltransferase n=1 Tax=Nezara viridula TaxID=85310 RepID=A0A9P0E5R4_NEZVI|nr:unnamed protein product [Nezara viridula]
MDPTPFSTKSRRNFRNVGNIWNDFSTIHQPTSKVVIERNFPLLTNTRRWFSHPYFRKKIEPTVDQLGNLTRPKFQSKKIVYGSCPWVFPNKCYDSRPIMALHEEINDFYNYMSPTPQEHAARKAVIRNIEAVIIELWPSARVQVIGSFRTGLYLPSSDINLLVIGNWSRFPLNTLKHVMAKKGVCIEKFISVFESTRGPVLKLRDKLFDFEIQISFNESNGPQVSELIKEYKAKYPILGKLALVLKQFLYQRGLHEVLFGGLSYYGLIMMIVSFLQLHPRPNDAMSSNANLGVMLIEFFELYGRRFNYSVTALKTKKGGSYSPKNELAVHTSSVEHSSMLCIEDPLNSFIDLGHGFFRALHARQAFALAFATLNMVMNGFCDDDDSRPQGSILGTIIRVSPAVIRQRQEVSNNFLVITSAIKGLDVNSASV